MIEPWDVPSDWRWQRFQDVARVASDLVDPADFGDLPHVAPNHIEGETGRLLPHKTVREDGVTSAKHRFHSGQILYSKIRPYLAKVVLVDFDGLCSADMYPIETDLQPKFLKWWMLSREFTRRAAGEQARTILPKINRRALDQLPVPIPPDHEQRQIVEVLEDHLSRIDAGNRYLLQSARRVDAWAASMADGLIWGPEWSTRELGSVLREPMRNGRSDRAVTDGSAGIRTLTLTAVTRNEFTDVNTKLTTTTPEAARGLWLEFGDILVQRSNTPDLVGTAARFEGPHDWAIYPDLLIRVRPDEDLISSAFMCAVLRSERAHRSLRAKAKGLAGSMPKIDQAAIAAVQVPVPTSREQESIVTRLAEVEAARADLSTSVRAQRRRAVGMRRAVLAAAFSGNLTGGRSDLEAIEEFRQ